MKNFSVLYCNIDLNQFDGYTVSICLSMTNSFVESKESIYLVTSSYCWAIEKLYRSLTSPMSIYNMNCDSQQSTSGKACGAKMMASASRAALTIWRPEKNVPGNRQKNILACPCGPDKHICIKGIAYTSQPRCPGATGRIKDTGHFSSGIQTLQNEFLYNLGIGILPVSNRRQVTHCGANEDISPLLKQAFRSLKRG